MYYTYDIFGFRKQKIIEKAVQKITDNIDHDFVIHAVPYDDQPTYDFIINHGPELPSLNGEFAQKLLNAIQPSNMEQLKAIFALYRPKPLEKGIIPEYVERRHGRAETVYEFSELEEVLRRTYGFLLYETQIKEIVVRIADLPTERSSKILKWVKQQADLCTSETDVKHAAVLTYQVAWLKTHYPEQTEL